MKKRIFAMLLLVALTLSVFTACADKASIITTEQAQKIALEQAGLTDDSNASIHTHVGTQDGIPCYSVHIAVGNKEYSYMISASDGQILESSDKISH